MAFTSESVEKCWVGTSMEDIHRGRGPWHYKIPPVAASRHHSVLYQLPATLKSPPKTLMSAHVHHWECWDDNHVSMPFSKKNLFPVKDENGEEHLKQGWELIRESLLQPINSSQELEAVISSYNTRMPTFLALHNFLEKVLEEEECQQFFETLLPGIIKLALRLPEILPGNLPLLKQGFCRSITLSQLQIASLLANAFLCTFPLRKDSTAMVPGVNFISFFASYLRPQDEQAVPEKLKCICHYFRRVLTADPVGIVTFERKHLTKSHLPRWNRLENNLGNTRMHISSSGVIEDDGDGLLQVDFANKNVGGGVLAFGCVQEEIRYIICPELIISRLFTEQLGPTEALVVTGAERYSNYTGYSYSFKWAGNCHDKTPYDSSGRRRTCIVAMDALHFINPMEQYHSSYILRELNKAYAGFHSRFESQLPSVATGNWGCGAFRGDPYLKSLIQLMACCAARRDMVYFTFGDSKLRDSIHEMHVFLATNQITIAQLWRHLCRFSSANLKPENLFSFIYQAHLDSKSQLFIKDFFCFNKKKSDKSARFTSNSNNNCSPVKNASFGGTDGIADRDNLNTEKCSEDVIIDVMPNESSDVIESLQTENTVRKPMPMNSEQFKENIRKPKTIVQQKQEVNQNDVLHLINVINGKSKNSEEVENLSSLSSIEKLSNRSKEELISEFPEDVADKMEVDDEVDVESTRASSSNVIKESSSLSKQKIPDYFVKTDKM